MLNSLQPGDVVTVTRIDRLARSTFDLFGIVKRIVDAKAQFRSLTEPWADTGTSTGRLMLAILGGLADVERDLIRTRTAEGRSRAKAQGKPMGRPPTSARRSRTRPPDAARRVLRSTNSPAVTTWAYPPFTARREPHDHPARQKCFCASQLV
jgi:DNA invertase Pin-like site-specific DNA recombinase